MSRFAEVMNQIARQAVREDAPAPTVQGYIPKGGVQEGPWTCTVRYPNPYMGMDPGQIQGGNGKKGSWLEKHGVALPRSPAGVIQGVTHIARDGDCPVLISFKGKGIDEPVVMEVQDFVGAQLQQNATTTRSNPTAEQGKTAAPAALPAVTGGVNAGALDVPSLPPGVETLDRVKTEARKARTFIDSPFGGERTPGVGNNVPQP
jgi:hypothetical protein